MQIVNLPKINDSRGNLTFFEELNQIPYNYHSIQFIYDKEPLTELKLEMPTNEALVIALSGSLEIVVSDKQKYVLNQPNSGLIVETIDNPVIKNFSNNSFCLIIYLQDKS